MRVLGVLDESLEGKQWLIGDRMTYADLAFVPYNAAVPMILGWPDDVEQSHDFRNMKAWHERMTSRSSCNGVRLDRPRVYQQRDASASQEVKSITVMNQT